MHTKIIVKSEKKIPKRDKIIGWYQGLENLKKRRALFIKYSREKIILNEYKYSSSAYGMYRNLMKTIKKSPTNMYFSKKSTAYFVRG